MGQFQGTIAKKQILSIEKVQTGENVWKIHYQKHKVSWEFVSVMLDNVVRMCGKMRGNDMMEQSLMWQNGIWLVEYKSSMW